MHVHYGTIIVPPFHLDPWLWGHNFHNYFYFFFINIYMYSNSNHRHSVLLHLHGKSLSNRKLKNKLYISKVVWCHISSDFEEIGSINADWFYTSWHILKKISENIYICKTVFQKHLQHIWKWFFFRAPL